MFFTPEKGPFEHLAKRCQNSHGELTTVHLILSECGCTVIFQAYPTVTVTFQSFIPLLFAEILMNNVSFYFTELSIQRKQEREKTHQDILSAEPHIVSFGVLELLLLGQG
jgi:hypothetical protein